MVSELANNFDGDKKQNRGGNLRNGDGKSYGGNNRGGRRQSTIFYLHRVLKN